MKCTVDNLTNKYAEVGTSEADIFLQICAILDIRWCDGSVGKLKCLENHVAGLGMFVSDGKIYLTHVAILKHKGFTPLIVEISSTVIQGVE